MLIGVCHGHDFAYYFKFYMDPNDPNSAISVIPPNTYAEDMSTALIKLLVAFAKDGWVVFV